jgi:prophage regulatory protein
MPVSLERPRDAAKRCGISVSQLYREVKVGRLSPPIKVGERASAFPSEEIDRFIAERIRESRKTQRAGTPAPIPEPQA